MINADYYRRTLYENDKEFIENLDISRGDKKILELKLDNFYTESDRVLEKYGFSKVIEELRENRE